jgi:hypothetical protein
MMMASEHGVTKMAVARNSHRWPWSVAQFAASLTEVQNTVKLGVVLTSIVLLTVLYDCEF